MIEQIVFDSQIVLDEFLTLMEQMTAKVLFISFVVCLSGFCLKSLWNGIRTLLF